MKSNDQNTSLDARYRTMLILWFALFMNIGVFFVFAVFMTRDAGAARGNATDYLSVVLLALGTFSVVASFVVKKIFLTRSVDRQDLGLVQQGLIFACAMCEVSALLGLIGLLLTGNREYYILFLIAAGGEAAHFPRRDQLLAASYKNPLLVKEIGK